MGQLERIYLVVAIGSEIVFFISLNFDLYWATTISPWICLAAWLVYVVLSSNRVRRSGRASGMQKFLLDRKRHTGPFRTSWAMLENFPTILVGLGMLIPTIMLVANFSARSNALFPVALEHACHDAKVVQVIGRVERVGIVSRTMSGEVGRLARFAIRIYGSKAMVLLHVDMLAQEGAWEFDSVRIKQVH